MELPQYNDKRKLADKGVSIVKSIIENDLKWIFRKVSLDDDFGLDGYIDILQDGKFVTGKSIGIQIKTGISYFENVSNSGWLFYGESKHLNYYLNNRIPIIIVLVNPETKEAYWNEINFHNILKTEKSWKLNINKNSQLNDKEGLLKIVGSYVDYGSQLENLAKVNKEMIESGLIFIAIDRNEIEDLDCEGIELLLKWLTASDEMIQKCRNKLIISVFGFDNDKRELFEILEVRKWMKNALTTFKYWGYFFSMKESLRRYSTLKILMHCNINVNVLSRNTSTKIVQIDFNIEESNAFISRIFSWLNEFAHLYNIDEKVIFEQSMLIKQTLEGLSDENVSMLRKKYGFE